MDIQGFQQHLRARGMAIRTIESYVADLVGAGITGEESRGDIEAILAGMRDHGNASTTIARRFAAMRSYFGWARPNDSPTTGLRVRRVQEFCPTVLTEDELRRLFRKIAMDTGPEMSRDYAIVSLLARRGLRVSEVATLNLADVEPGPVAVTVNEKGGRRRRKVLGPDVQRALRIYMFNRWEASKFADSAARPFDPEALFIARGGVRISVRRIEEMVAEWVERAQIRKKITPHGLRHTFATLSLARSNGNIRLVQEALGHKSIAMTARYLHPTDDDIARMLGG